MPLEYNPQKCSRTLNGCGFTRDDIYDVIYPTPLLSNAERLDGYVINPLSKHTCWSIFMKPKKLLTLSLTIAMLVLPFTTARARFQPYPQPSQFEAYYVDRNDPQASDSNPGTQALPWLTIQHAGDVLEAGETVYVRPGFYSERVTPQNAGEPRKTITFQAIPPKSVTMWGFDTVNSDYLRIEGFNIATDYTLTGWTERYGVFVRSDYVEVVNNHFFDLKAAAIQGNWGQDYPISAYIADNKIYHSQMGIVVFGDHWIVDEHGNSRRGP